LMVEGIAGTNPTLSAKPPQLQIMVFASPRKAPMCTARRPSAPFGLGSRIEDTTSE
jgi:hypothetical protein